MARTHARVNVTIWDNPGFVALSGEDQLTYLMLFSQPNLSNAGALTLALKRWAALRPSGSVERLTASLERLEAAQFIAIDWETEELVIRTFVRHDWNLKNPKSQGAVRNALPAIISKRLRRVVVDAIPSEYRSVIAADTPIDGPEPLRLVTETIGDPIGDPITDRIGDAITRGDGDGDGDISIGGSSVSTATCVAERRGQPNPHFDALVDVFGDATTKTRRKFYGSTAHELRTAGATPDEIRERGRLMLAKGWKDPTPAALVKHWDSLGRDGPRGDLGAEHYASGRY